MRIIPKRIKVKNTVWKCYSMPDILVALVMFAIIFIAITKGNWVFAGILGICSVILFMPTQDGIFYACILENVKFLFERKRYTAESDKPKENINVLLGLKAIKENGIIEYTNGKYGRVIKLGQKNFGIEELSEQNIDINYFSNAIKQLELNQAAELVKIDRPVKLDGFAKEVFGRLEENLESEGGKQVREIRNGILQERLDTIDRLNNVRKEYLSDFYLVVYGNNEPDVENTSLNMATEIGKSGLAAALLGQRETAVFLKYSFSRNFEEREVKDIAEEKLADWVLPKELIFSGSKYMIDGEEVTTLAVSDYPLRVKNAWGADLFNIPNTKVVMHIKPVEKYKAIKRIDKCIGEMETKQLMSEKASEANSAETHRESMDALLDSLQTENESLFDVTLTITAYNYLKEENYKKECAVS